MSKLTFYSILATIGVFVFIGLIVAVSLFAFPVFKIIITAFGVAVIILLVYVIVRDILKSILGVEENDDYEV